MLIPAICPLLIPSYTYNNSYSSTENAASYTFSAAALGVAAPTRFVVIATARMAADTATTLNTVTIGGVDASVLFATNSTNTNAFWGAVVPTGTAGDIVLSFSATQTRAAISVYSLYELNSSTPFTTATQSLANPSSVNLGTIQSKDIILARCVTTVSTSTTWSGGVAEDSDFIVEATLTMSTASIQAITGATNFTPQAEFVDGAGSEILIAAGWR